MTERTTPHEFVIYTGPMMSGKSSRLLYTLDRLDRQGRRVVTFKPTIDTRYAVDKIVSHTQLQRDAICVETGEQIISYLANDAEADYDAIGVDEAFMIEGSAETLKWLFFQGESIYVATLDMSSTLKPFSEFVEMTPWATRVDKIPAVCSVCGGDAFYTWKTANDESEILVGARESYEPRCSLHHPACVKLREEE